MVIIIDSYKGSYVEPLLFSKGVVLIKSFNYFLSNKNKNDNWHSHKSKKR